MNHPVLPRVCALGVLSLGLSFAARTARAGELSATASFAVARDPSGQRAAAIADALIKARVAQARSLRLIDAARVVSGDPRTREEETLERARTALADGRRAYDALKLDEAIARIGQAVNLYQQTGPLLGDLEELETALAYLGAALTLRGSADEGQSAFVELLTIDPNHQLQGYPPVVMRTFENASKRLDAMKTGSVEIYSTPPYAAVYVDGRFEGVTPLVLPDLVAGTHYLRIEKIGYTVFGAPLEISAHQKLTSQTRLRSMKKGAELRDLTARATDEVGGDGMGGALRSLSRLLVADTLIFVGVTQSGNDATFVAGVYDATSGARIGAERAVINTTGVTFGSDLDRFASNLVSIAERGGNVRSTDASSDDESTGTGFGLGGATAGSPGRTAPPGSGSSPPGEVPTQALVPGQAPVAAPATPTIEYVGWTLVGIGSASAITGIVFGVLAKTVHDDYRATPQGSPGLEDLRNKGKTDALIADVTLGAGLAVGIGGGVLVLLSRLSEPTPEELLRAPRASVVPRDGGLVFTFGTDFP